MNPGFDRHCGRSTEAREQVHWIEVPEAMPHSQFQPLGPDYSGIARVLLRPSASLANDERFQNLIFGHGLLEMIEQRLTSVAPDFQQEGFASMRKSWIEDVRCASQMR
jgi:hypothetical protein